MRRLSLCVWVPARGGGDHRQERRKIYAEALAARAVYLNNRGRITIFLDYQQTNDNKQRAGAGGVGSGCACGCVLCVVVCGCGGSGAAARGGLPQRPPTATKGTKKPHTGRGCGLSIFEPLSDPGRRPALRGHTSQEHERRRVALHRGGRTPLLFHLRARRAL